MAGDPYDDWKDQGRPGGSYSAWLASQQQAAPPPAEPTSAAPAAPAPSAGGTPTQATAASANTSQSLGGVVLPPGASGYNASDPTAYRNIDPNIVRNMTPEQRAEWSAQNIDDLSAHGDATRARAQWLAWQKSYDPNCPPSDPYQAEDGSGCVEKPDNSNKGHQAEQDGGGDGRGGRGGQGGGYAPPPPPPPPTTFGNQLSMTGNPLQDMLIGQFNTGQDPNTQRSNIFGLGEDMRVGGTGANLDANKSARQAQSLSGGGLWWGQGTDTFSGFDASKKNAEGASTPSPAAPAPAPAQPALAAAPAVAPTNVNGPARMGGMYSAPRRPPQRQTFQAEQPAQPTQLGTMVQGQFSSPNRNRASYF